MGARIEWASVPSSVYFEDPGAIQDAYGTENDELALCFGDGVVVEGSAEEWGEFAEKLLAAAKAEIEATPAGIARRLRAEVADGGLSTALCGLLGEAASALEAQDS